MPHRWNRVSMYVRRAPVPGQTGETMTIDPRDHAAIQRAVEGALDGLEIRDFQVFRVGDELPSDTDHSHVVLDQEMYRALMEVLRQAHRALSDGTSEQEKIAAVLLLQKALSNYHAAADLTASRPPHPQIEGPGWRHY